MIFTITTALDRTVGPRANRGINRRVAGVSRVICRDMHICGNIVSAALSPMCLLQIVLLLICMSLFKMYVKLIYKKYPLQ